MALVFAISLDQVRSRHWLIYLGGLLAGLGVGAAVSSIPERYAKRAGWVISASGIVVTVVIAATGNSTAWLTLVSVVLGIGLAFLLRGLPRRILQ
jgi:hypothetical protein